MLLKRHLSSHDKRSGNSMLGKIFYHFKLKFFVLKMNRLGTIAFSPAVKVVELSELPQSRPLRQLHPGEERLVD